MEGGWWLSYCVRRHGGIREEKRGMYAPFAWGMDAADDNTEPVVLAVNHSFFKEQRFCVLVVGNELLHVVVFPGSLGISCGLLYSLWTVGLL